MNEKTQALVMANARRLILKSRATTNVKLYMSLFAVGMRTGLQRCKELGLEPNGNETNFMKMMDHIELKERVEYTMAWVRVQPEEIRRKILDNIANEIAKTDDKGGEG